jgi:hypothetical protein
MRTVAIGFILLTGASAPTDEASPPAAREPGPAPIPADVQQLRTQWMHCSATVAKAYLRSSRPAATVADVAVQRCRAQEEPLARVLAEQLGKEAAARILELVRETDRSNLIRAIEVLRARQK